MDVDLGSSLIIANERIYACSPYGVFHCLGASNGRLMWEFKINDMKFSSPAFFAGFIYICSYDGKIFCLGSQGIDTVFLALLAAVIGISAAIAVALFLRSKFIKTQGKTL